jgi:hypothetical protein
VIFRIRACCQSDRQRLHDRVERPDGVLGIELDLQPALAAVQIDTGFGQRGLVDRHRHPLLLRERADAADMIS